MKMKMRRAAYLCAFGATALASGAASAALSNKELLKVLLENGAINQAQYDKLLHLAKEETKVAGKEEVKIKLDEGKLKLQTAAGDFEFEVGGRLQADAAWFDDDVAELGDGTEIRRARLHVAGKAWNDWNFKTEVDFAEDKVSIKDAWIEYSGLKQFTGGIPLDVKFGNFKEPFSLEELTSSRFITFMERAMINEAFVPSRNLGLQLMSHGNVLQGGWTAAGGWFGKGIDDSKTGDESYGVAGRLTFAPIATKTEALHFGGAIEHRKFKGEEAEFRSRPEAHIADQRLVELKVDANDVTKYGLELAGVYGPFSVQGEYILADVNTVDDGNLDLDGWYAFASWFLTGESRNYKASKGAFDRVKPRGIVGKGGYGAFELAARYSQLNLNDSAFKGGREDNVTLGLNWYATPNIRFMANYIIADVDGGAKFPDDDPNLFQIRGQVDF